ncbi:hypothetical protein [Paenibacillus sp. UMB4589-SE434]|uniref:hypothetical protein n=1 Tax=Paenibacillus sp. UMB4589-SE434 TaxID=3046314 RepID=UPI00254CCE83|nr:hypothetical protein [Paenibacillus sp. UMB4589-SE434]MDK8179563.1 hypothetical protein [Paenibacillus sp. UMB4589-SE434]
MNEDITKMIDCLKVALKEDPSAIVFGKLNDGITGIHKEADSLKLGKYYDLLKVTNGARCGDIDLWSYSELEGHQYVLSDMQDDKESWLAIGQILYEPILMNRFDGNVYRLDEDGTTMNGFGELDFFMQNVVFGSGYCRVIPDSEQDDWLLFLKKKGIISD